MKLYHYTCGHSIESIRKQRWVLPNGHPLLPSAGPLVHLTDLEEPDRIGLGLTSYTLNCDRTEYRVTVSTFDAVRWPEFARSLSRTIRDRFENYPGALPMHWWVASTPVAVLAVTP